MKCLYCGQEITKGANFCQNCGIPIDEKDAFREDNNVISEEEEKTTQEEEKKERKKRHIPVILMLCMIAVAGGFVLGVGNGVRKSAGADIQEAVTENSAKQQEEQLAAIQEESVQKESVQKDVVQEEPVQKDMVQVESEQEDMGDREAEQNNAISEEVNEEETMQEEAEELTEENDATEGGIHRYEYVIEDCTWSQAFYRAQERGGYLVRINNIEEYCYIISEADELGYKDIQFRIGARRDNDSFEYYWADDNNELYGDPINDSNYWTNFEWMEGEPSFIDGETQENCIDLFYYEDQGRWVLNDVPNDILAVVPYFSGKIGYIVEYED